MSVVWMNTASWLLRQYVTARRSGHERQGKEDKNCNREHVGQSEAITGHWMGMHVLVGYHVLPPPAATPRPMTDCAARCLNFGLSAFKFEWGLPFPNGFLDECQRACLDWQYEVAISATGFRPTSPTFRRWLFWIIVGSATSVCFAHDYWMLQIPTSIPKSDQLCVLLIIF
jgi:hypothetical protein